MTLTGIPSAGRPKVRGHGLKADGSPFSPEGKPLHNPEKYAAGWGHGMCQCGQQSPMLPTAVARKEWHVHHLAELQAAEEDR